MYLFLNFIINFIVSLLYGSFVFYITAGIEVKLKGICAASLFIPREISNVCIVVYDFMIIV